MPRLIIVFLVLVANSVWSPAGQTVHGADGREIAVQRTRSGVRYGMIGEIRDQPAPTLFVLAHGIEEMRRQPVYTEVSAILAEQGWASVVIEPPCHGEDARADEPAQLEGWRYRLERDDDFLAAFVSRSREIVNDVIEKRIADPDRLAVCGTSRGGFLAFHLAAADRRMKAAAGISPVTKLTALREFRDTKFSQRVEALDVQRLAAELVGRNVWLSIGNHDLRVDTDAAIEFSREVVRRSIQSDQPQQVIPVELIVAPAPGHSKIDRAHELLADWLKKHVVSSNTSYQKVK
jgi:poly(3-hydroxybutyrate) depolymerase